MFVRGVLGFFCCPGRAHRWLSSRVCNWMQTAELQGFASDDGVERTDDQGNLLCDIVLHHGFGWEVSFATHTQVSADKRLKIAVEDLVHVADLDPGAEIFGHAVGLQDVAANL